MCMVVLHPSNSVSMEVPEVLYMPDGTRIFLPCSAAINADGEMSTDTWRQYLSVPVIACKVGSRVRVHGIKTDA